jgi:hypothetical protein
MGAIDDVTNWHAKQDSIPNVSEAIYQSVATGLKAKS